jgi:hypothetical protein
MTETKELTKDRNYYRSLSTFELWEITRYGIDVDWKELAITLGERMGIIHDEIEAAFYEDFECPRCGFVK